MSDRVLALRIDLTKNTALVVDTSLYVKGRVRWSKEEREKTLKKLKVPRGR